MAIDLWGCDELRFIDSVAGHCLLIGSPGGLHVCWLIPSFVGKKTIFVGQLPDLLMMCWPLKGCSLNLLNGMVNTSLIYMYIYILLYIVLYII